MPPSAVLSEHEIWGSLRDVCTLCIKHKADEGRRSARLRAGTVRYQPFDAEFTDKGAEVKDGQWGYRVVMVADPDGNTLMFNYTD